MFGKWEKVREFLLKIIRKQDEIISELITFMVRGCLLKNVLTHFY